jgi:hypothetical protein
MWNKKVVCLYVGHIKKNPYVYCSSAFVNVNCQDKGKGKGKGKDFPVQIMEVYSGRAF